MTETDAYITVGSNIRPEKNIALALGRLGESVDLRAVSTFYRTRPLPRPYGVGGSTAETDTADQPDYLNGVVHVRTGVAPRPLKFEILRPIEAELGRGRGGDSYAARTIDLDIAVYGDRVIDEDDLRIPDPDIRTRPFVAVPLLELAPELILPDTGEPLAGLEAGRPGSGLVPDPEFTAHLQSRMSQ